MLFARSTVTAVLGSNQKGSRGSFPLPERWDSSLEQANRVLGDACAHRDFSHNRLTGLASLQLGYTRAKQDIILASVTAQHSTAQQLSRSLTRWSSSFCLLMIHSGDLTASMLVKQGPRFNLALTLVVMFSCFRPVRATPHFLWVDKQCLS